MARSTLDIDLSPPIARILKHATAEAHERAEKSPGAGWLVRGELDKGEYIRSLMMLYHIYHTLERGLEHHASHPALRPTYNPTLLARTSSLSADIAHFLQIPESLWHCHPTYLDLVANPPKPLSDYAARIQHLIDTDPTRLLAHTYVRYLGDLSGGQTIKRGLIKAYGLGSEDGVSFYTFRKMGGSSSETATIGDMKRIKEWFREGMNVGVGDDTLVKEAIIDEANIAFDLNTALLSSLRSSSCPRAPPTQPPACIGEVLSSIRPLSGELPPKPTLFALPLVQLTTVVAILLALSFTRLCSINVLEDVARGLGTAQRWVTAALTRLSAL